MEEDESKTWNQKQIRRLIELRFENEAEFRMGRARKGVLWQKIWKQFIEEFPDRDFTKEDLQRKFINLCSTYKRIKNRCSKTKQEYDTTCWEYFDMFEEVWGQKYSENFVEETVSNSFKFQSMDESATYLPETEQTYIEAVEEATPKKRHREQKENDEVKDAARYETREEDEVDLYCRSIAKIIKDERLTRLQFLELQAKLSTLLKREFQICNETANY